VPGLTLSADALRTPLAAFGVLPEDQLALAVSGGPDSLALLLLAAEARPGRVMALTVDHRLRAESTAEAAEVASACAARDVPHATLRWEARPGGNVQAEARAARYRLMADWCASNGVRWLATAHHADDQAETLLMRLARGSGVAGLGGIRPLRPLARGLTLVRPLLGFAKRDLAAIVKDAGLAAADDPSNRDPAYDRTAARALLAATEWLDPKRLAAAADHARDAADALDWAAERAWEGRAEWHGPDLTVDAADLPRALRFALLQRAAAAFGAEADGPELDRLLAALSDGETRTVGSALAEGGALWRFRPAPPRAR